MKKILFALGATALLAAPAAAQIPTFTPFSFEARAGAALPTGELNDGAGPGFTFSGSVTYHAIPLIGIYAGGTYSEFSVDDSDADFRDAGLDVGARLGIPTPLIPIDPWIKGGLVVHQAKLSLGSASIDTDWGVGFEVGAGLGFGFGPVSITPGVSFVRYNAGADDSEDGEDVKIEYVKADIGVRIRI